MNTEQRIISFMALAHGWSAGAGEAVQVQEVIRALGGLHALIASGFEKTDSFPGPSGEVMVTAYEGENTIELLFETDSSCRLCIESGDDEILFIENMSDQSAIETACSFASWGADRWGLYASSIQSIMTPIEDDLQTWHSGRTAMPRGTSKYPASVPTVPSHPAGVSANTFANIMPLSLVSPRFTNISIPQLTVAA